MLEIKDYTDDQLVGVYRQLRAKRDADKAAAIVLQAPVLEHMRNIEAEANKRMQERGNTSFATDEGTCYTTTVRSFTAKDAAAFFEWVKANDEWDLLDIKPAKAAVTEYLERTKELPVGLSTSSKVNTNFNAPRKK